MSAFLPPPPARAIALGFIAECSVRFLIEFFLICRPAFLSADQWQAAHRRMRSHTPANVSPVFMPAFGTSECAVKPGEVLSSST